MREKNGSVTMIPPTQLQVHRSTIEKINRTPEMMQHVGQC